jgi:pimeloyl-ACP methyl ester carboxylesterase
MTGSWYAPVDDVARRRFDVRAAGHRLCAEWLEPAGADPAAPPLVFLHEGLGSIGQWVGRGVHVPAALARATGRRALVYDRLGFGGSDPLPAWRAPDYLYREARETLAEVLDRCGIDRAVPVGHSDGASIALLFAAAHPQRAAAVVAMAAHVIIEPVTLDGIRRARAAYHAPGSRLRASLHRHHGAKTDWMFANWADVWLSPPFAAFDMRAELPRITCPVLALQGARDEYGSPGQVALIAAGVSGPCEPWIVPDCRHVPHFQATEPVLDRIAGFVTASAAARDPAGAPGLP